MQLLEPVGNLVQYSNEGGNLVAARKVTESTNRTTSSGHRPQASTETGS